MPIREKTIPVRFTPRGLVDALDATDKFPGASTALTNLVFDQSNPEIMVSRPGVGSGITSFAGFLSPGVVSVHVTIGTVTYGMIATARNSSLDEPFAYDHSISSFLPVSGVLAANCPTTQPTGGAWTPPTMASVGVNIIVTHPGFPGGATKFGYFDITNPAAPAWNAGDTSTNGLSATPVAVANFNNRAYFAVSNRTEYTDVLTLNRAAAAQSLTFGDASALTALSGLPIQTTSSGVTQALLAFKAFQVWQVTGDPVSGDLSENFISIIVGSSSPRSIIQSPQGTYFASFFAPMMIDQFGLLRAVTHALTDTEPDVRAAWQNAVTPSRIAGGYTGRVYRVSMETIINGQDVVNDYWFDENKRRWTGPHSFPYDCVSQLGSFFILSSNANPGKLFKSEPLPSSTSTYLDNGAAIMSTEQSSTFPKTQDMAMNQVVESTIELSSSGSPASYAITALDEGGNTLNSCIVPVMSSGTLWGAGVWGGFNWASSQNRPATYTVPWTAPLVFNKMAIYITVTSGTAIALGTFFARYKKLGYTLNR